MHVCPPCVLCRDVTLACFSPQAQVLQAQDTMPSGLAASTSRLVETTRQAIQANTAAAGSVSAALMSTAAPSPAEHLAAALPASLADFTQFVLPLSAQQPTTSSKAASTSSSQFSPGPNIRTPGQGSDNRRRGRITPAPAPAAAAAGGAGCVATQSQSSSVSIWRALRCHRPTALPCLHRWATSQGIWTQALAQATPFLSSAPTRCCTPLACATPQQSSTTWPKSPLPLCCPAQS